MNRFMILCNGNPPDKPLFQQCLASADCFIAADGGGNRARELGGVPDIVIGDLDSFEPQAEDNFKVAFDPDQNSNDLEKALKLSKDKGATHVQILGATGLRLDHSLKNLSVLQQFTPHFDRLWMSDNYGELFLLPKAYSSSLPIGTQVSLFPLSGRAAGITTEGLKFSLKEEALENGVRDGSSNEVVGDPVKISYTQGDLLIFIAKATGQI